MLRLMLAVVLVAFSALACAFGALTAKPEPAVPVLRQ